MQSIAPGTISIALVTLWQTHPAASDPCITIVVVVIVDMLLLAPVLGLSLMASLASGHRFRRGQCPQFTPAENFDWDQVTRGLIVIKQSKTIVINVFFSFQRAPGMSPGNSPRGSPLVSQIISSPMQMESSQ